MSKLETLINQMKQNNPMDIVFRFESSTQIDQFISALKEHKPVINKMQLSFTDEQMTEYFAEKIKGVQLIETPKFRNEGINYLTKEYFKKAGNRRNLDMTLCFEEDFPVLRGALQDSSVDMDSLTLRGIDKELSQKFVQSLKKNPIKARVRNLQIYGFDLQSDDWSTLLSNIGSCSDFINLTVVITKKEDIEGLAKALNNHALTLSSLNIAISSELANAVHTNPHQEWGKAFIVNPIQAQITHLRIDDLHFDHDHWKIFLKNLGDIPGIQDVSLQSTNFDYIQYVDALAGLIALNSSIEHLMLYSSNNREANAGDVYWRDKKGAADKLAVAMQKNNVLELFLYGTNSRPMDYFRDDIDEKLRANRERGAKRRMGRENANKLSTDNGVAELCRKFHNYVDPCLENSEFHEKRINYLKEKLEDFEYGVQLANSMMSKETADKARTIINYFKSQYQLLDFVDKYIKSDSLILKKLADDIISEWRNFAIQNHQNLVADTNELFKTFQKFCDQAKSSIPASEKETNAVLKNVILAIVSVITAGIALLAYLAVISVSGSWKESGHTFFKDGSKPNPERDVLDQLDSSIKTVGKGPQ